jgi:hypothetical protein
MRNVYKTCKISDRLSSANFCVQRVPSDQRDGSLRPYSPFSGPELIFFLSNNFLIVLTGLSEPRSRPTTSQKIR